MYYVSCMLVRQMMAFYTLTLVHTLYEKSTPWDFDNEYVIQMSSNYGDTNGYEHNLDLLCILQWLSVSYSARSGCIEKSIQITHVYLITHNVWLGERLWNNVKSHKLDVMVCMDDKYPWLP